jgi:carboxylesterase type B
MRGKTAQEIIDTFYSFSGTRIILRANVDGWLFSDQVYEIFSRGEQNDVPVIVGSNADEGTVFANRAPDSQQAYQERAREKYQHLSDEFSPSILLAPTRRQEKPLWRNSGTKPSPGRCAAGPE